MTKKITIKIKHSHLLAVTVFAAILSLGVFVLVFFMSFYARIYPGVWVGDVYVGGQHTDEAKEKLSRTFTMPEKISILIGDTQKEIGTSVFSARYDFDQTTSKAYLFGREGGLKDDIANALKALTKGHRLDSEVYIDEAALERELGLLLIGAFEQPIEPSVSVVNGQILIERGKEGYRVDQLKIARDVVLALKTQDTKPIVAQRELVNPVLRDAEMATLLTQAQILLGKKVSLVFENEKFTLGSTALVPLLSTTGPLKIEVLSDSLNEIIASVEREAKNPVFNFEAERVVEFSPAKDGIEVNRQALETQVVNAVNTLLTENINETETLIPVKTSPPALRTEDVNNLGIKELIGRGISAYRGSIPARVHNIALAASRVNGALVAPGETMSFNKVVGDISALSGYKQSYVIQGDQTVLGDGGGVCQVSTTLFRAALDAGLPIIERNPHSYRVGYYEQGSPVGIDATIYSPSVDLKIKNDTPGHILVQTIADTKNMTLAFEIYGTKDSRVVTISKPTLTNVTPPPEDLYIDDPNLPLGKIEQVEHKAWGGRASFNYTVVRDNDTIFQKNFVSNYKAWGAKFLRGVGPTN